MEDARKRGVYAGRAVGARPRSVLEVDQGNIGVLPHAVRDQGDHPLLARRAHDPDMADIHAQIDRGAVGVGGADVRIGLATSKGRAVHPGGEVERHTRDARARLLGGAARPQSCGGKQERREAKMQRAHAVPIPKQDEARGSETCPPPSPMG